MSESHSESVHQLTSLGSKVGIPNEYTPDILERFLNPRPTTVGMMEVVLDCPEFTSLCPKTEQPDFGRIVINYVPDQWMVESKSLKLYLGSFRNHGAFHEECIGRIGEDLVELLRPVSLRVEGHFNPRGGISIHPYFNYTRPSQPTEPTSTPQNVYIGQAPHTTPEGFTGP